MVAIPNVNGDTMSLANRCVYSPVLPAGAVDVKMRAVANRADQRNGWAREATDLVRAAAGGTLIGVPLLYTVEVWWIGSITDPQQMFVVLAFTFVVVFLLNRTSGFRSMTDSTLSESLMDTVEALAIALVSVTLILVLFREITARTPATEALGKIVYQTAPFGLGIGLARHFLQGDWDGDDDSASDEATEEKSVANISVANISVATKINGTLADVGATVIGSVFLAFSIAPTDEVALLASAISPVWLLGLLAFSILISYAIVFEAGLTDEQGRLEQQGVFQSPLSESVASYLVALMVAALMLWFFQRIGVGEPLPVTLSYVVVLGFPAAVGGAAGRLAV